ncbi:MAG: hypothetical protein GY749_23830 [Desulfobacteraceae bacterium]|nr:hypothetical protein [Desulfobacteraceae bacterium]
MFKENYMLLKQRASKLSYPFALRKNPHAQEVCASTTRWVQEQRIVESSNLQRFLDMRSWDVVSYAYPDITISELTTVADWISWVMLADDQYDERPLGRNPKAINNVLNRYHSLMVAVSAKAEDLPHDDITTFEAALIDVVTRIFCNTTMEWRTRFIENGVRFFSGCLQEAEFRSNRSSPSLTEYMELRLLSVGMYQLFDMLELYLSDALETYLIQSEEYQKIRNAAAYVCAWANDIYSYPKESTHKDPCNLICVLTAKEGFSFESALNEAIELHDSELQRFFDLESIILKTNTMPTTQAWLCGLKNWMVGALIWHREAERYR